MKCLEPTDKTKTCLDILLEAQTDVSGYFKAPQKPEEVLQEILHQYGITETQLYQFRYIKVKRLYMFLLHEVSSSNYEKIAELTKCRNELEVIHGIEKIKAAMRKDSALLAKAGEIVDRLKAYSEKNPREAFTGNKHDDEKKEKTQ